MKGYWKKLAPYLPAFAALVGLVVLVSWWNMRSGDGLRVRVPGTDAAPGIGSGGTNPVLAGKSVSGPGQSAETSGDWPQFRGPGRDGIARDPTRFSRDWATSPPHELWALDVGEGYAGVAVNQGRVYLLDYDRDARQSALRCLSVSDGKEIWRFVYPLTIKRNHGMTRTVPAVTDKFVVALDSKCNVLCLDAASGELRWTISLVHEFGATVPEWYAGQCPLVDGDKVILAPGGKDALLLAVDLATGRPLWQTPNPHDWKMTHSSVMPMDFAGHRIYLYCASGGVVGVDAQDGAALFETSDWKISIATVPSPLALPDGKIFLTGGYNAGSLVLQLSTNLPLTRPAGAPFPSGVEKRLRDSAGPRPSFTCRELFRLTADVFGATQHTPIFRDGHIYGVRADGRLVCLNLDGKVVCSTGPGETFGLGSFLMAGDLIYAMNDSGTLRLIEATPSRFNLLGQVQVLKGRESWAPMALTDSRLVARDLTRLVCLEVGAK